MALQQILFLKRVRNIFRHHESCSAFFVSSTKIKGSKKSNLIFCLFYRDKGSKKCNLTFSIREFCRLESFPSNYVHYSTSNDTQSWRKAKKVSPARDEFKPNRFPSFAPSSVINQRNREIDSFKILWNLFRASRLQF